MPGLSRWRVRAWGLVERSVRSGTPGAVKHGRQDAEPLKDADQWPRTRRVAMRAQTQSGRLAAGGVVVPQTEWSPVAGARVRARPGALTRLARVGVPVSASVGPPPVKSSAKLSRATGSRSLC